MKKKGSLVTALATKEDFISLIGFVFYTFSFGVMTNFALWVMWNAKFTWYSWFAYGFIFWIVENRLNKWIRGVIFR